MTHIFMSAFECFKQDTIESQMLCLIYSMYFHDFNSKRYVDIILIIIDLNVFQWNMIMEKYSETNFYLENIYGNPLNNLYFS